MHRQKKQELVADLHSRFARTRTAILLDYRGLSVQEMTALRRLLQAEGAELKVVKNTLARRASKDTPFEGLEGAFSGPTSVALCAGDIVAPAKALRGFGGGKRGLQVTGGLLEGRPLGPKDVERAATLPPRDVLLAQLMGGLQAPLGRLAGVLRSLSARLIWTLVAIRDQRAGPPSTGAAPGQEGTP